MIEQSNGRLILFSIVGLVVLYWTFETIVHIFRAIAKGMRRPDKHYHYDIKEFINED